MIKQKKEILKELPEKWERRGGILNMFHLLKSCIRQSISSKRYIKENIPLMSANDTEKNIKKDINHFSAMFNY